MNRFSYHRADTIDDAVRALAADPAPKAFLLWGAHAARAAGELPRPQDLVVASAHPSPLSARRGFLGSRPFSQVNDWLRGRGETAIDWSCDAAGASGGDI